MEEYLALDGTWEDFAAHVGAVLEQLPQQDAFLLLCRKRIGADDPHYFVQFATLGGQGLRAEAVSNSLLRPPYELSPGSEQTLWELGWRPPKRDAEPPGDLANYHLEWPSPPAYLDAAKLAAATLHIVYGAISPSDLEYKCFLQDGRTLAQPSLGIDPRPIDAEMPAARPTGPDMDALRAYIDTCLREILHTSELKRDDEGDVPIQFGSALAFVRVIESDFPSLHVFAPVVWGLTMTEEILEAVNDINRSIRFGRATWENGAIIVAVDLPTPMLTKENIAFACDHVGTVADHYDDRLQDRFGGSIMFGEARPPKSSHVGGYL